MGRERRPQKARKGAKGYRGQNQPKGVRGHARGGLDCVAMTDPARIRLGRVDRAGLAAGRETSNRPNHALGKTAASIAISKFQSSRRYEESKPSLSG